MIHPGQRYKVSPVFCQFGVMGNEARASGYVLPEPFGIGYGYMNLRQDVVVDKINFISPKYPGFSDLITINAGHTREKNESHMLKLDTWILPFFKYIWRLRQNQRFLENQIGWRLFGGGQN